jgi:hypothetical protein
VGHAGDPPPIVIGQGNRNRQQLSYDTGNVLPYAIGTRLVVLDLNGNRTSPGRHRQL